METTQALETKPAVSSNEDFLPIEGWDHIELYVGNAKQSAFYYQYALGFQLVAYSGLETGNKEKASYMLQQGKIRFVLSTPLHPDNFISEHIKKHGDGVRDIALTVKDATSAFKETVKRGAKGVLKPTEIKDENGVIIRSAIQAYGDTIHSFIERKNYTGFLPDL
jgi:4-hydroxyphenylpyruvate dioxygenase